MDGNLIRIAGKYLMRKRIGGGSFGDVYLGIHMETYEELAIKLESTSCSFPQVIKEAKMLKFLKGPGIPKVHWFGTEGQFNIMVLELLGPSFSDVLEKNGFIISLKSLCQLAEQSFRRIESVHSKGYIHRDIKPENLLMGLKSHQNSVYLIDFGLAKRYRDVNTNQHIPFRDNKSLTGTARFASINSHMGIESSRRDDIEALFYLFIYLGQGALPWQGLGGASKQEKYTKIMDCKVQTPLDKICGQLPSEFVQLVSYSRGLRFEEAPDFEYIYRLIKNVVTKYDLAFDGIYDWTVIDKKNQKSKAKLAKKKRKKIRKRPTEEQEDKASRDLSPSLSPNSNSNPSPSPNPSPKPNSNIDNSPGIHEKQKDKSEIYKQTHEDIGDLPRHMSIQSTISDSTGPKFTNRDAIYDIIRTIKGTNNNV